MKILVANLGSTSFKYRLFDMRDERQLARGGTERIGSAESRSFVEIGPARSEYVVASARSCRGGAAMPGAIWPIREHGCLQSADEVAAIGFKAVHGGRYSGVQRVTPDVLAAMEDMHEVAPAHNPPYVAAMRLLERKAARDSAGGGVRNRLSSDDSRLGSKHYAIPWRMGRRAPRAVAGDFTGQPSLHRRAHGRTARAGRICGSSPAIWAARTRCVRFATAKAWPPAWA